MDEGAAGAGQPVRGPKFRRRAEARPDEVLDAALDLFIEKGFAATRVEDIARRAGISKGAVYLYFPSKETILEGIVRRAVVPLAEHALGFLANYEGDPRTVITMVLKMLAARLRDPRVLAIPKVIVHEVLGFPELAQMYRREVLDKVIPVVEGLIRKGVNEGYLRPVDPELTVRSIVGPILAHVALFEIFDIKPADGIAIDRLIDNHLTILFDGLSAPSSGKRWSAS
ncbi:MAG TPA: TetR/AcrR family transcriptional regulator [Alphaproteobacteria bacterium]|nr:TetR/AcrR family transcriptional regulator [Alphaproteobacteria bacterium]